jgi:hypothetical protein
VNSQDSASGLRVPDDQIDYDDELVYFYRGERFTGIGYDDVPDFGLSEVSYADGLQDGPARDWFPSGQLKSEALFHKNLRHGLSREFREDGSLASEEIYEYGVHLRSCAFDADGRETITFELSEESPNYRILQRLRSQFGG